MAKKKSVKKKKKAKKEVVLTEREQGLVERVFELNKTYGKEEAFILPGSDVVFGSVRMQPTGIPALDRMLGGGFPEGKNIEVFGPEGGGKTTLVLNYVGERMKEDKMCVWFDAEDSLEVQWAKKFGIRVQKQRKGESLKDALIRAITTRSLLLCKPQVGEHALDAMKAFCGFVDVMVVDSVPALQPIAMLEASNLDNFMGLKARMISQGIDNIVSVNKKKDPSTIIWINQLTTNIGGYGNPEITPGGKRLKFYARLRLGVRQIAFEKLDKKNPRPGQRIACYAKKNSYYPPHRKAQFNLMYKGHFDIKGQIIDLAKEYEIIERKGSYLHYRGEKRQGDTNFKKFLIRNPDVYAELLELVVENINEEIADTKGIF